MQPYESQNASRMSYNSHNFASDTSPIPAVRADKYTRRRKRHIKKKKLVPPGFPKTVQAYQLAHISSRPVTGTFYNLCHRQARWVSATQRAFVYHGGDWKRVHPLVHANVLHFNYETFP